MLNRVAAGALETCLIVLCGFTIVFGQSTPSDDAAKDAVGRAQSAYLKKDYALAKRELEKALAIRKDLAEPRLLLGLIAWQEGNVDDAIKSVKEAIKYRPDYPDAHYVMGKLFFEKRDWKSAQGEANLALNQGLKSAGLYILLGDMSLAQEKYEPAVKFFEHALAEPSSNHESANETRIKIEAVKNYIELEANKKNRDFQIPKLTSRGTMPKPVPFRQVDIKLGGVLDEQGRYTPFLVIHSSDQQMTEIYLKYVTEMRFTPAKKNGAPLPIWQILEYQTSSYAR